MANELTTTSDYSKISPNSYAAFDAISLRNLILQRLNEEGTFTDQNYIGSNLASIIDIISYAFNTLMFYLNRTSTESMFTEAQLYENINRIVKLLDYKPVGYQTSTLPFQVYADTNSLNEDLYMIPRFSYIMIGGIPFSFNEDITFSLKNQSNTLVPNTPLRFLADVSNSNLLYQGIFRENPVYTATGTLNEVISLNLVNAAVDHFNIQVYVWEKETETWYKYNETPNLYTDLSFDKVYEKRLNSDRIYEITFGNGINGRALQAGDKVAVYFLQTYEEKGVIGANVLENAENTNNSLTKSVYSTPTFNDIFEDTRQDKTSVVLTTSTFRFLRFANNTGSTLPKEIETADSIRQNAPSNFKSQYRLVTKEDYETFVRINFDNFISDVKVFSNWDYVSKYLKYFKDLDLNATTFQQITLNQTLFSDACNFNNIYVCALPKLAKDSTLKYLLPAQKELIVSQMEPLKTLTSEVTFLDPIYKAFKLGFGIDGFVSTNPLDDFQLEVTKQRLSTRTNQSIIADVVAVFTDFFNPQAQKLGAKFEYTNLITRLLSIPDVEKLQTVYYPNGVEEDSIVRFDGVSFVSWNPTFPELDIKEIAQNTTMNPFECIFYSQIELFSNQITIV